MRVVAAAVVLLGLLLPVPGATAQDTALLVLEDKAGDVQTVVAGTPGGNPSGRFTANDLLGLTVAETAEAFVVSLQVASLATSPEAPAAESTLYTVDFSHGAMTYRVLFWRQVDQGASYGGQLEAYDPGRDDYNGGQRLAVTADAGSNTMSVAVPRDQILDEMGAAPFPGRSLTGFHASSSGMRLMGDDVCLRLAPCQPVPPTAVTDRMPDKGIGPVDVPVLLGLAQTGYARLSSDTPVRASNGEATTFVFEVNAQNLDGKVHIFSLVASSLPMAWQVSLPAAVIELGPNQTAVLPVLVSTPFGHNHGTFQDFLLEMTSVDDAASVGRVELGVRYLATPQPAGHHNLLYLHTAKPDGDATFEDAFGTLFGFDPQHLYFNTMTPAEDENDDKTPVGGSSSTDFDGLAVPNGRYTWTIPLSPALAMGMDFDLATVGSIRILVDSVMPLPGAVLEGRIIHNIPEEECDPRDDTCEFSGEDDFFIGPGTRTTAALVGPSAAVEVSPNAAKVAFEAAITPTLEGDYLPFQPGATLTMQLNLTFTRPDPPFGPHDIPKITGGQLTLPLLEYHDPVSQVFASSTGLMIRVDGEQQRQVNAGETAVFDLSLMNHGDQAASYRLELSGPNLAWADILGDEVVTIVPGEVRQLAIAVAAPPEARQGDIADIVLTAVHTSDPTQRTLARLVVLVDEGADHADDSSRVAKLDDQLAAKQSPAVGPVLLLAALVLAVAGVRRRRAT